MIPILLALSLAYVATYTDQEQARCLLFQVGTHEIHLCTSEEPRTDLGPNKSYPHLVILP